MIAGKDRRQTDAALQRLSLASHVREMAATRREVKFRNRPRASRAASWIVGWFRAPTRLGRRDLPLWRRRVYHATAILSLRLVAGPRAGATAGGWTDLTATRTRNHEALAGDVTSYATAVDETMLVRRALLLRLLGRHGTAVDLLLARYRSGRPATRSRAWLQFLLGEIGEEKAGDRLPAGNDEATDPAPREARVNAREALPGVGVRAAIVVLAMFDSAVFRASLASLLGSDFAGEIMVIEDGDHDERRCENLCREAGVGYRRNAAWLGSAASMNAGIEALSSRPHIVVVAHSDVLWPSQWWRQVGSAWDRVLESGKVSLLNLSYVQIGPTPERALAELFLRGEYEDLWWLLRQMRTIPSLTGLVEHSLVEEEGVTFGLGRDVWNDRPEELKSMAGRFSVAASFPYAMWEGIGRFDPALMYGPDLQLQYESLVRRQWTLWVDHRPLIHLVSSDTRSLDRARRDQFADRIGETNRAFKARYGTTIDHFLASYFGETAIVHRDAIVAAVNEGRFEAIDYVFDEFWQRFSMRRFGNCDLLDCRSRHKCPYV